MTEITNELLRQLLFSVKIADHSVPDNIKSKFNVLLQDLKIILEKMGTVLVDDHNDRLLKSFLDVCHASGAVNLMIEEYEGSPMKPINKQDLVPFNFSYVHPYLPPQQWKRIGDSIVDHPNCTAHRSLYKMMVQKVEAVAQVEEGSEGPGTQTARRLLSISDPQWLWEEITNLAPLFQANEVVQLITTLIESFGNDQDRWLSLLKRDEFVENRRLVLALALKLLNKVADIIGNEHNDLGKEVLDEFKIEDLLEYELSLLITEDESIAEEIGVCIKTAKKIINNNLNLEMADNKKLFDASFVRVLHFLPLHHFSVLSQTCLSLAIIGILGQMSPNPEVYNLLLDILFRMIKNPANNTGQLMVCGLNSGILLKFISQRGVSYPTLKPLIRAICKESLNDKKTAKKLIKAVSKPTVEDVWQTSLVIEEVNQLKQKKKVDNEQETEDVDSAIQPAVNKDESLDSLVRSVIPILESESPSLNLLPTYAVILRLHFRLEKDFGSTSLINKIEDYLRLCALDPEQGFALLDTLILFRNKLDNEKLRKTIALDGWKLLIKDNKEPKFLSRLNAIFTSCTDEEFKAVMADLLSETSNALYSDCDKLSALFELWCPLVSSMVSFSKSKSRQEALVSLAKYIVPVVERWRSTPEDKSIKPVLKFFTNLASSTAVEMKPAVLDTFLVCLQAVPVPSDRPLTVLNNLPPAVEALFGLYLFRNVLVLDRLHVYLPIYRKYLTGLARISGPDSEYIENAFPCADKLERVAKTLVKRQKDFSRLAQYVIADVIAILELHPLHSEVKSKYTNIINTFLALCDEHAVSYLTVNLPPSSQELFKTLHHNFMKYDKYTGRI
uniref:Nucleolar 27S pre-rRNA processing Urb2/Npa2 C-terminal domain-containing protein n=3 Tax=Lygus hesperus TaxID=30085 RepID=A0A146LDY9_LYGHE